MLKFRLKGAHASENDKDRKSLSGSLAISLTERYFETNLKEGGNRRAVRGYLTREGDVTTISFLMGSNQTTPTRVFYHLTKKGKGVEGRYEGEWGELPYSISQIRPYEVFTHMTQNRCDLTHKVTFTLTRYN